MLEPAARKISQDILLNSVNKVENYRLLKENMLCLFYFLKNKQKLIKNATYFNMQELVGLFVHLQRFQKKRK